MKAQHSKMRSLKKEASKCKKCNVTLCNGRCEINNDIPSFNKAVSKNEWLRAYKILSQTNNFPEFTGRICPAPCEISCVLNLTKGAVPISDIEKDIIENAFNNNWVRIKEPKQRIKKNIAIIGSGPAGLSAAEQLNLMGYSVTVYEKDDRLGGLLRYGIPDFKLEKWVIDRRIDLMKAAGIVFKENAEIGLNIPPKQLETEYDATLLCCGALTHKNLDISKNKLKGIHFAMDYLKDHNKKISGLKQNLDISAKGKKLIVIGSGDTAEDCIEMAYREGATSIVQIGYKKESIKKNRDKYSLEYYKSDTFSKIWCCLSKEFIGDGEGKIIGVKTSKLEWLNRFKYDEIENSESVIECDMVIIAIGFLTTNMKEVLRKLYIDFNEHGKPTTNNYQTTNKNFFCAGDMNIGSSLVIHAISEGRAAARAIDQKLKYIIP